MNYTHCEIFKDYVKYQCDDSAMYEFDNGYGAIVECNESVLCITIIKDIDGHEFNYAYPDFAHGYSIITGVETQYLIYWLTQINGIKGGHKMTKLDTLKQQTADLEAKLEESTAQLKNMKAEIDRLENGWEMKCPYEEGDNVFKLGDDGLSWEYRWNRMVIDEGRFEQGNIFLTREAARLESKRRNLLTRFRAFRDECNDGWEPDWSNRDKKWEISHDSDDERFKVFWCYATNSFSTFGYFKNEQDAQRAIDLFGDEIKELFMEEEQHA